MYVVVPVREENLAAPHVSGPFDLMFETRRGRLGVGKLPVNENVLSRVHKLQGLQPNMPKLLSHSCLNLDL